MWLLNTARAELKYFPTPESVPGGYAILSHVWNQDPDPPEQSFKDIQDLCDRCKVSGENPRDHASDKIRGFCLLAERDGYQWGWNDTCCIDKSSSAELTEAINSMYRYYSLADVCYAYLQDVPSDCVLDAPDSAFRQSKWHRRGWTLQELIAPPFVIFFSKTWEPLGSKADFAPLLEEITWVPQDVLKLSTAPSDYCVAARMAWAANRETTRPEDQAYSLMGLFGIFMPALYGEGRNAFRRLQEEIMRQSDDSSMFAWGGLAELDHMMSLSGLSLGSSPRKFTKTIFFAESPSDFYVGRHLTYEKQGKSRPSPTPWFAFGTQDAVDLSKRPTFNITPYGVAAHVPVVQYKHTEFFVAVLLGTMFKTLWSSGTAENTGLLLRKVDSPDPTRPLYVPLGERSERLLVGDFLVTAERTKSTLEWRTIYIVHHSLPTTVPREVKGISRSLHMPFHIPRSHIIELLQNPNIDFLSLEDWNSPLFARRDDTVFPLEFMVPSFWDFTAVRRIIVYMGLCSKTERNGHRAHWATVNARGLFVSELALVGKSLGHICSEHHVDEWVNGTRVFTIDSLGAGDSRPVQVKLSLKPYVLNPAQVRKVHIDMKMVPDPCPESESVKVIPAGVS